MIKKSEKIKILVVEPNKEPYEKEIEDTLEEMQKIVGGLIEFVELEKGVDLVCNEEGKIYGLEMNRVITNDVICGTFFIVGQKKGESISLTDSQIKKYKEYFNLLRDRVVIELLKKRYKSSSELSRGGLIGVENMLEEIKNGE